MISIVGSKAEKDKAHVCRSTRGGIYMPAFTRHRGNRAIKWGLIWHIDHSRVLFRHMIEAKEGGICTQRERDHGREIHLNSYESVNGILSLPFSPP